MRDRPSYDQRRRPRQRRNDPGQRNLLIGGSLFVLALLVVGALVLTGDDDTDAPAQGDIGTGLATSTAALDTNSSPTGPGTTSQAQPAVGTETATLGITPTAAATPTVGTTPTSGPEIEPTETSVEETAEETVEAETGPEPEDTVEPDPEPTEAVAEEPAPDEEPEPLIGDFGQLPPAQIVSGGVSRNLDLSYELDTSAVSAPETALVYQLVWPDRTIDEVQRVADSLGVGGTVEDLGDGNYRVFGDTAELFISPEVIQYVGPGDSSGGELEDDATLGNYALEWLAANGLISTAPGAAIVTGRDTDANIAVVFVKPSDPSPMLAAYPSASVTLSTGGIVQQANIQWPITYTPSEYGMKSLNEVWNRVLAGEGAIEADLSGVSGSGPVSGSFTVSETGVGYSLASGGEGDFLVPLMVFYGTAVTDTGESFDMAIYLPAVQGEVSAAG